MSGRRKRKAVERTEVVEEGTNPNHAECSAGGWEDGWEGERGAPLPGFSAHGTLQARMLEWVAIPFSRGSSPPSNPDPCFPGALDLKEATSISDKLHK